MVLPESAMALTILRAILHIAVVMSSILSCWSIKACLLVYLKRGEKRKEQGPNPLPTLLTQPRSEPDVASSYVQDIRTQELEFVHVTFADAPAPIRFNVQNFEVTARADDLGVLVKLRTTADEAKRSFFEANRVQWCQVSESHF
jgi:hypothetical protein